MRRTIFSLSVFLMVMLVLSGCFLSDKAVLDSLEIDPGNVELEFGQIQEFVVTALDQKGKPFLETDAPEFETEGNIGTLNVDGFKAELTAVNEAAEGKVIATIGDVSVTANVTIMEEVVDSLVWFESFEDYTEGQYPGGDWFIKNEEHHDENDTGPRVVADEDAPDGEYIMKYTTGDKDVEGVKYAELEIDLPYVENGRLDFCLFQPANEGSNFGVKPILDGDKLADFWISSKGDLRVGDSKSTEVGTWLEFRFEWQDGVMKVYQLIDDDWVEEFSGGIEDSPEKISIDGRTESGRGSWGALDNFRLYDLDLIND